MDAPATENFNITTILRSFRPSFRNHKQVVKVELASAPSTPWGGVDASGFPCRRLIPVTTLFLLLIVAALACQTVSQPPTASPVNTSPSSGASLANRQLASPQQVDPQLVFAAAPAINDSSRIPQIARIKQPKIASPTQPGPADEGANFPSTTPIPELPFRFTEVFNSALENLNDNIQLNPDSAGAFDGRGTAYLIIGDYESAIRDFDQALRLDPQMADSYANRGTAYRNLGPISASHRQL